MTALHDAIDELFVAIPRPVLDALILAWAKADADVQANLLNDLGEELSQACAKGEADDVDAFVAWQGQIAHIAANLDDHGRHLIAELALALEAIAEQEAAEAAAHEEPS